MFCSDMRTGEVEDKRKKAFGDTSTTKQQSREKEREVREPTLKMFVHPLWSFHILGLFSL